GEFRKALLASIPAVTTSQLGVTAPPLPYQGPQFGQTIEGIVSAPGQPSRETTPMINQAFSANTADHFSLPAESGQYPGFSAGALPKETRMGIVGSEAKETRMGAIAAPGPGPAASGQSYAYQEGAIQAPAAEAAAPKGKLNWKHYTAAGAIASVGLVASVV